MLALAVALHCTCTQCRGEAATTDQLCCLKANYVQRQSQPSLARQPCYLLSYALACRVDYSQSGALVEGSHPENDLDQSSASRSGDLAYSVLAAFHSASRASILGCPATFSSLQLYQNSCARHNALLIDMQ